MQKKKQKRRGGSPFSLRERSIIEVRWCRDGKTVTDIAKELKRHKSSVSRDIGGRPRRGRGKYDADRAHEKALDRIGNRGNVPKTARNPRLRSYIETRMKDKRWAPEQVSIRLPIEYPEDEAMRAAPETIYQEVYRRVHRGGNGAVKRGELDLRPYLPRRHQRRAKKGFRKAQKAERDASLPSIETRPTIVEKRKRIGDWEDDTLVSRESHARLKNATERRSGLTFLARQKTALPRVATRYLLKSCHAFPRKLARHSPGIEAPRTCAGAKWKKRSVSKRSSPIRTALSSGARMRTPTDSSGDFSRRKLTGLKCQTKILPAQSI